MGGPRPVDGLGPPRSWRAVDTLLALALLGWAGAQALRAHAELAKRPVVQGPNRVWRPPEADGPLGGEIIDPRADGLATELAARYGLETLPTVPTLPDTLGPGDGSTPRLLWPTPDAPVLVVGSWGGDLVVFLSGVGVVIADPARLPADAPALALQVPREQTF